MTVAKAKGSGIPLDKLEAALSEADDYRTIIMLRAMTELLTDAWERGEISTFEGVMLDIGQYLDALQRGHITIDEVNHIVKNNSAKGCVLVPLEYIEEIMQGWKIYADRDGELTLGEAYKIEGGGQGRRRRIDTLKRFMRDVRLCDRVGLALVEAEKKGEPISRERAYEIVAEATSQMEGPTTPEVVRRAYRARGQKVLDTLISLLL